MATILICTYNNFHSTVYADTFDKISSRCKMKTQSPQSNSQTMLKLIKLTLEAHLAMGFAVEVELVMQ